MAKFHINPEKGPKPCSAKNGQCPYGSDAPHFETREAAQSEFENILEKQNGAFAALKKTTPKTQLLNTEMFVASFESMAYSNVEEFANASRENHEFINRLIDERSEESYEFFQKLEKINPNKVERSKACDQETYKSLKRDYEAFRDKTAELVEAHTESKFYKQLAEPLPNPERIGDAVRLTGFAPNTPEWLEARLDTVGGSDVGALVTMDFKDPKDIKYYDKAALARVEKSKLALPTADEIAKMQMLSKGGKAGNLYRGTVWESRIQDGYVRDHPEVIVYETKDQYVNGDNPWQKINVDGVIADRRTNKPVGILEIKTGGNPDVWADGVPLSYRGQTLYYLKVTGLKYADVRVVLNDREVREYRLYADDPIVEDRNITMNEYVETTVSPWFENLKSRRALAAA